MLESPSRHNHRSGHRALSARSKICPRPRDRARSLRGPGLHEEGAHMKRLTALLLTLMLVVGACSSDSSTAASDDEAQPNTTAAPDVSHPTTHAANTTTVADADEPQTEAPPAQASGAQSATVTLDNGEAFEFGALCWLEVQESAGSEILFTVVSYDDPVNLDVTQFGADSFSGAANISLYDSTSYDNLWEAS